MNKNIKLIKLNLILSSAILAFASCQSTSQESTKPVTSKSSAQNEIVIEQSEKPKVNFDNVKISLVSNANVPIATVPFKTPFVVCVKDNQGNPLKNYPITVTYPETENYTAAVNSEIDVEVFDFEFDIDSETKLKIGHDAVQKILSPLIDGEEYIKLAREYDAAFDIKTGEKLATSILPASQQRYRPFRPQFPAWEPGQPRSPPRWHPQRRSGPGHR